MVFEFKDIEEKELKEFKGGLGSYLARMYVDPTCKIMRGRLKSGSSIGYHKHENDSEIIFMIKGTAKVVYNGEELEFKEGSFHYCPKGSSHSLTNEGDETIEFYAVVPTLS